jgi:DNA-binding GntR family transcriptional regulator
LTAQPDLIRSGPTPIFEQIKSWIRLQIQQGVWPEHFQLKSETDLADAWGVSRGTIRKAITDLIGEGLLVRIHGRGTFVASGRLEQPLAERLVAFSEDLISKSINFETEVMECSVILAPPRIASLLNITIADRVLVLKRVRSVAGAPLILLHNYVVYDLCPAIEQIDFHRYRLFETLEDRYGLKLDWGRRYFEAQVASPELARYLGIDVYDPVMSLEQLVYLDDGTVIEFSDVWLRGDRFRLSATVRRDGLTNPSMSWVEEARARDL